MIYQVINGVVCKMSKKQEAIAISRAEKEKRPRQKDAKVYIAVTAQTTLQIK